MVDLMQKNLQLVMEAAAELKLTLPVTGLINQLFMSLQGSGEGRSGTQALVKALERITGVEVTDKKDRD